MDAGGNDDKVCDGSQKGNEQQSIGTERETSATEYAVIIKVAVRPDLRGPLRGVCIDLDLHHGLGKIIAVRFQAFSDLPLEIPQAPIPSLLQSILAFLIYASARPMRPISTCLLG